MRVKTRDSLKKSEFGEKASFGSPCERQALLSSKYIAPFFSKPKHAKEHSPLRVPPELELSNSTTLLQMLWSCYNCDIRSLGHDASSLSGRAASDSEKWVRLAARHRSLLLCDADRLPHPESHLSNRLLFGNGATGSMSSGLSLGTAGTK